MKRYAGYIILCLVLIFSIIIFFNITKIISIIDIGNLDEYALIKGFILIFILNIFSKLGFTFIKNK